MAERQGRSFVIPLDLDSHKQQQARQREPLEARLEGLLHAVDDHFNASERALEGVAFGRLPPFGEAGVMVPSSWVGREFKGEPRPVLARLMSRKSEPLVTILMLLWLWDLDPWDSYVWDRPWSALLPQLRSAERERGVRRAVGRALQIITEEVATYDKEMRSWKRTHHKRLPPSAGPQDPDRIVRAWTTPQRPLEIGIPATFFENGWHLALTKPELAWWLAGRLITTNAGRAQSRMKDRYLGFSKHVTGTEWLPFSRVLEQMDVDQPAAQWMSRLILQSLGERAHGKWPKLEFSVGEYPELVVRGTTQSGKPAVLIGTSEQWHLHETLIVGRSVDLLERRAGHYPWLAAQKQLKTRAVRDSVKRQFRVYGPGKAVGSDPIFTVFDVEYVWGSADHYSSL